MIFSFYKVKWKRKKKTAILENEKSTDLDVWRLIGFWSDWVLAAIATKMTTIKSISNEYMLILGLFRTSLVKVKSQLVMFDRFYLLKRILSFDLMQCYLTILWFCWFFSEQCHVFCILIGCRPLSINILPMFSLSNLLKCSEELYSLKKKSIILLCGFHSPRDTFRT